ncbi:MAG TPA: DUF2271 domain-containing protein [Cellvibrionaceae bacterium]
MQLRRLKVLDVTALLAIISAPLQAATIHVAIEIPRLDVAEYHRPYVALWVAQENHQVAMDLAVWYDLKMKDSEGEKWLKDMRQWWRRSGRSKVMPIDGVSGATRAPGKHQLVFAADKSPLENLPEGSYLLMVEAAREVGGREILQIPFSWPAEKPQVLQVEGESELGEIVLTLSP